jgi:hypothetical protein
MYRRKAKERRKVSFSHPEMKFMQSDGKNSKTYLNRNLLTVVPWGTRQASAVSLIRRPNELLRQICCFLVNSLIKSPIVKTTSKQRLN